MCRGVPLCERAEAHRLRHSQGMRALILSTAGLADDEREAEEQDVPLRQPSTMAPARRVCSPGPVRRRAPVNVERQHPGRHAERSGVGDFNTEPKGGDSRLSGDSRASLMPHGLFLSGYSALLRPGGGLGGQRALDMSRRELPTSGTRVRPPMLPAGTSGGRRAVSSYLRATGSPAR